MADLKPAEVARAWFERVWNQGDLTAIDELFPADGIAHGLSGDDDHPVRGPAHFKEFASNFRGAVPDIRIDIVRSVTEGSLCAAYCLVTGTHLGDSLKIPATGRPIRFNGMTLLRVENGQIREAWNTFDILSFYQQIGAAPKI